MRAYRVIFSYTLDRLQGATDLRYATILKIDESLLDPVEILRRVRNQLGSHLRIESVIAAEYAQREVQ